MDKFHDSLLLYILSRLDDSADVARCRVAWKAFDAVFPGLRSINLRFRNIKSRSRDSSYFRKVFLDLLQKPETIESVSISIRVTDFVGDEDFLKAWLPFFSGSLKSLSLSGFPSLRRQKSNVLLLISVYCRNLVNLKLTFRYLSMQNLHPMLMLTSLTLESIVVDVDDKHLNDQLNKCFPNLRFLKLRVKELKDLKIRLPNLQACHWIVFCDSPYSLTLITPKLVTLKIDCFMPPVIHVEAPMLTHFRLTIYNFRLVGTLTVKRFENLKTLSVNSSYIGSLLSEFPITKTVETLALYSQAKPTGDVPYSKLTLAKLFTVFPNMSSLRVSSGAWTELEACVDLEGWDILDGRKGLKTIRAYLMLVDTWLTFSCVARVLDQCVSLSEVSLLVHRNASYAKSLSFISQCMACWPGLKWRWGIW